MNLKILYHSYNMDQLNKALQRFVCDIDKIEVHKYITFFFLLKGFKRKHVKSNAKFMWLKC